MSKHLPKEWRVWPIPLCSPNHRTMFICQATSDLISAYHPTQSATDRPRLDGTRFCVHVAKILRHIHITLNKVTLSSEPSRRTPGVLVCTAAARLAYQIQYIQMFHGPSSPTTLVGNDDNTSHHTNNSTRVIQKSVTGKDDDTNLFAMIHWFSYRIQ